MPRSRMSLSYFSLDPRFGFAVEQCFDGHRGLVTRSSRSSLRVAAPAGLERPSSLFLHRIFSGRPAPIGVDAWGSEFVAPEFDDMLHLLFQWVAKARRPGRVSRLSATCPMVKNLGTSVVLRAPLRVQSPAAGEPESPVKEKRV